VDAAAATAAAAAAAAEWWRWRSWGAVVVVIVLCLIRHGDGRGRGILGGLSTVGRDGRGRTSSKSVVVVWSFVSAGGVWSVHVFSDDYRDTFRLLIGLATPVASLCTPYGQAAERRIIGIRRRRFRLSLLLSFLHLFNCFSSFLVSSCCIRQCLVFARHAWNCLRCTPSRSHPHC